MSKDNKLAVPREYWRYRFAGNFLGSILATARKEIFTPPVDRNDYCRMAVEYADLLIEELEREKAKKNDVV